MLKNPAYSRKPPPPKLPPITQVRWKAVYSPIGGWVDQNDVSVVTAQRVGNFRAKTSNLDVIVIMTLATSGADHGTTSVAGFVPTIVTEKRLVEVVNLSEMLTVEPNLFDYTD